jgi:hypothetical protein
MTCRKQAQAAKLEAEKEGIVVPLTLEEYCMKSAKTSNPEPQVSNNMLFATSELGCCVFFLLSLI